MAAKSFVPPGDATDTTVHLSKNLLRFLAIMLSWSSLLFFCVVWFPFRSQHVVITGVLATLLWIVFSLIKAELMWSLELLLLCPFLLLD